MLLKSTFWIIILLAELSLVMCFEDIAETDRISCSNPSAALFDELTINSFTDENKYIRLNISWKNPLFNFSDFDLAIDTNCSALYGDRNIPVNRNFVIQPDIERLTHPAEPLAHGCRYFFEFSAEALWHNSSCLLTETRDYKIPDCVGAVCACGVTPSPFDYYSYEIKPSGLLAVMFNVSNNSRSDQNLEQIFDKIWFSSNAANDILTTVAHSQLDFDNHNNVVFLPVRLFNAGQEYVIFIDMMLDTCEYHDKFSMQVPKQPDLKTSSTPRGVLYVFVVLIGFVIIFFIILKKNPRLLDKLNRYLPYTNSSRLSNTSASIGVSNLRREVINTHYTPLEFMENVCKFDKYELPRNKIILKNEIGGGAFGKVYKANIYNTTDEYCEVAVKKPFDYSPAEEICDFLAEIAVMKKIAECGSHPNIITLLGCVTYETPYLMIMELVPCGSLKTYLTMLRNRVEENTRIENNQRFFPDNMVVENYLPVSISDSEKLKYTNLVFDDYTGSTCSSETNSYITPETPRTPNSPGSPVEVIKAKRKKGPDRGDLKILVKHNVKNKNMAFMRPACLAPLTPNSSTSGGLPSATETLLTPLESYPTTPLDQTSGEMCEDVKPMLDSRELCSFALQIANGMAFLEKVDITHRDLAARNILISEDRVLKISDFGMARTGVYVNSVHKRQPLRWMAPEAIESRICNNKTDVWSFGVVLWEIASLGAFPYKTFGNDQVIVHVLQGKRLERPEMCTDQLYNVMLQCWQKNPEDRPRFADLSRQLDAASTKFYVDLSKVPSRHSPV
ncbi:fibroblast growth factor receptor 3-like [Euwallacea similis]|uniref:fibroblast growth factor receptor 3-like n=1 Tax=Euwallacea similis TaxID=1736056 RepID=UPI00344BBBA6